MKYLRLERELEPCRNTEVPSQSQRLRPVNLRTQPVSIHDWIDYLGTFCNAIGIIFLDKSRFLRPAGASEDLLYHECCGHSLGV